MAREGKLEKGMEADFRLGRHKLRGQYISISEPLFNSLFDCFRRRQDILTRRLDDILRSAPTEKNEFSLNITRTWNREKGMLKEIANMCDE